MRSTRTPRRGQWAARRGGGIAALATVFLLAAATPASAHPYLLSSDPASGAILSTAPAQIDIDYTEGLDRPYCSVTLIGPNNRHIATHQVTAHQPTELSVAPDTELTQAGTYAVEWTAVGDDGHTVVGNFGFSVGHPTNNPAVANATLGDTGSSASPGGFQRLVRTVLPTATVLFAGVLLLGAVLAASRRRAARLRLATFTAQLALVTALAVTAIVDGGLSAFMRSATGHRLIAELLLTALAVPLVFDRGRLAAGLRPSGWRRWAGPLVAIALAVTLAFSGHASSQPASRRNLALAVYSIHLVAVSLWLGAIAAVVLRIGRPRSDGDDPARSLRPLVAGSLVAVLVSGVAITDWGLRTLHDLPGTSYGRLAIALLALFVAMVAVGGTASVFQLRRPNRKLGSRLVLGESVLAMGALVVAGVLGQIAQPLDQPYASQAYATETGVPVSVVAAGADALDVATIAPGIVGRNTLVVEVGQADEEDFLSPSHDARSVDATVSCGGCGVPSQRLVLHPTGQDASWTSDVTLPKPGSYLVTAHVRRANGSSDTVRLAARVTPPVLPDQVVVGVPASFSGPTGETCRDQVLGLQVAFQDLNASAADHGALIRVVAVDLHDGVSAAFDRLRSLGARVIAMPCGTTQQVSHSVADARAAGLPVVLGATDAGSAIEAAGSPNGSATPVTNAALTTPTSGGVWSTEPSWRAEGAAIAAQALRQAARTVRVVVGDTPVDQAELAGLRSALSTSATTRTRVTNFPSHPVGYVRGLDRQGVDLVVLLGSRTEATPIVHAFSTVENGEGWEPSHGILASAQLMSTDFINDAGTITRLGGIEFASDINPFDPVSQYYAQRLRTLAPGLRPSFDGLGGYQAGLAIAEALKDGGGRPAPARIASLFATRFHSFTVGSYQLDWQADGGTSTSLAFFRSTYVNPMAMPSNTPGGASALAHEGTFLDVGGFEQVAPFRRLT